MLSKTLGDYKILEKIGAGGMGEVYRARDTKLQREVAIKVLLGAFIADPERMARFQREARTLASLNHPHIAALFDLAEEAGQPYLIMELVEGENLAERLMGGAIPLQEALDIARQVADGLEEAHEKGVVHRDLKPANIKITPDGKAKILDFGLARAYLGETVDEGNIENSPTITAAMTQEGMILGTAAYMSPEQARGKPVDRRADLWSFGVILWEMITGKRLFEGETVSDTLAAVLRAEPPWEDLPDKTPPAVRRLLERCLERNPRKRLRDIGEARIRLERWRDDPSSMHQSTLGIEAVADAPRVRWLRGVPWVVAVLALLGAAWSWNSRPEMTEALSSPVWLDIHLPMDDQLPEDLGGGIKISPAGDMLAYIVEEKIYVQRLDQLQPRFLPGTEAAYLAEFSPDGQWIAFAARGMLKRISVTGGAPIDICELGTCRGFDWVDRSTLVISSSINTGLSLVSLKDGSIRELTTLDIEGGERSHRWPSAVPGGEYVLMMAQFLGRNYEDAEIQEVSIKSGERVTVYRGGAYPRYAGSCHLLFVRGHTVFSVPYSPGEGEVSGLSVPVLENVLTSVVNQEIDDGSAAYDLSSSGKLIYQSGSRAAAGNSRLSWIDLKTGTQVPFGEPAPRDTPRLSPDGKSLAVCRGEPDTKSIYVVDLATSIERRLTFRGADQLGAWSKDSQYLYWVRAEADGRVLYRQRADGSSPEEKLKSYGSAMFIPEDISPDGKYLLGSRWKVGGSFNVELLSITDLQEEPVSLVSGRYNQYAGAFSPDGRWVVYATMKLGDMSLQIMPYPDTGARWQVLGYMDRFDGLAWAADGSALFLRDGTGFLRIPVEVRGAGILVSPPERLILEDNIRSDGVSTTGIAPDGVRAVVLQPEASEEQENTRSIIFVNDWLPEMEKRVAASQ